MPRHPSATIGRLSRPIQAPTMPEVSRPANQPGDFLVDYEEKVFLM